MGANREHPDYPEYIENCQKLWDEYVKKEDAVLEIHPFPTGLDHPAAGELREISRQYNIKLKQLKQRYSYLFEETKNNHRNN